VDPISAQYLDDVFGGTGLDPNHTPLNKVLANPIIQIVVINWDFTMGSPTSAVRTKQCRTLWGKFGLKETTQKTGRTKEAFWKWVRTLATSESFYFSATNSEEQAEEIPNLLHIRLIGEVEDPDNEKWLQDKAQMRAVQISLSKWILSFIPPGMEASTTIPKIIAIWRTYLRGKDPESYKELRHKPARRQVIQTFDASGTLSSTEFKIISHKSSYLSSESGGIDIRDSAGTSPGTDELKSITLPLNAITLMLRYNPDKVSGLRFVGAADRQAGERRA